MPDFITIRFYEELNDFLHYSRRKKAFEFPLPEKRTVKDIIESLGVPHTEIDLILANREPVGFTYHPFPGDYISVYPVFESFDITGITPLRPKPLREPKFVLDVHLGTLARYLRLLGFDTIYRNDLADEEIIGISVSEHRIILTRDLPLLKNGRVTHGYFVRKTLPSEQLTEVVCRFDLRKQMNPFSRCITCNGIIEKIDKERVEKDLPPNTRKTFSDFYRCTLCKKVYWKGSHWEKLQRVVDGIVL